MFNCFCLCSVLLTFIFFSVANPFCSIAFTFCVTPKYLRLLLCNLIEIVMIIGRFPLPVYMMLIGWCAPLRTRTRIYNKEEIGEIG